MKAGSQTLNEGGLAINQPALPLGTALPRRRAGMSVDIFGVAGLVLMIALWWALTLVVPKMLLPTPLSVLRRITNDFFVADQLSYYGLPETGLFGSMLYTAGNVLVAVVLGAAIGTFLGLVTARVALIRAILDPIVSTVGTIPILVMAPFFLIWFGTERWSALLLVTIYVLVILYLYAQRAADNLDPIYEENARTFGATTAAIVRDVLVPGTLPQILGGIRIALAGAWGLEAIAELLGAQRGIGKIIEVISGSLDIEGIFAALLTLSVVAVVADFLVARAVGFATRWRAAQPSEGL
jgi:ABC-type nitrate/sulfonate/bicarbonate transport system permease component